MLIKIKKCYGKTKLTPDKQRLKIYKYNICECVEIDLKYKLIQYIFEKLYLHLLLIKRKVKKIYLMNFIVSSTTLLRHLQSISGVLATSNTLPILDNFLFEIYLIKLLIVLLLLFRNSLILNAIDGLFNCTEKCKF